MRLRIEAVTELREHIDSFRRMGIAPGLERRILREFYSHLEEEAQELEAAGVEREEAVRQALARFGPPREIARKMADLYARGSLWEAFLGAVPHLLIALTFLFHLWQSPSWILFLATLSGGLALYGWGRGKPVWFYPWLGYSLGATLALLFLALVLAGWGLAHLWGLAGPWFWGVVLAYVPLALGLLLAVASRVARHDWLLASLMFQPLPVLAGWALRLHEQGRLLVVERRQLQDMDPGMGLIFILLALAVAAFIWMRHRLLKTALLLVTTVALVAVVSLSRVPLDVLGLFPIALVLAFFLLSPALLGRWMGPREEPWAQPSWVEQIASQGWRRAV